MDNRSENRLKRIIKTVFFILMVIIIILLLLRNCNKKVINDGIKIIDIKQSVDSFNDDTIFLDDSLRKNKKYSYDITIHNYLDENYYLYKIEINNDFISYDELIKLLKSGKDTKFRLNIIPEENIKDKVEIKFYYGKIKEITVGDESITSFGDEKVQLPEGIAKEGYKFLGYTDKEDSKIVKYKENKEYDLKDGTTLYPVYKEDKKSSANENNPNAGTSTNTSTSTNSNPSNNNETKDEKKKHIITFDYQNGREKTTKEVTYNEKYGTLPVATKKGYAFSGWYLDNNKITSDSIVTITSDTTLVAKYHPLNA